MTRPVFMRYRAAVADHLIGRRRYVRLFGASVYAHSDGLRHGLVLSHNSEGPVVKYLRSGTSNTSPDYVAEGWDALFAFESGADVDVWSHLGLDAEDLLSETT